MKIVFMGTPDFAVPCLKRLISDGHDVIGVFTQPDKPKGRGYELSSPPVKVCAIENNIPVFQPKSMRDGEALKILEKLNPELIIVVAYGKILPPEILFLPKHNSINIHASLLPKYRGSAPIQWCILNGESETGVTSMLMDEGLDTGDMLLSQTVKITEDMTAGELHDELSVIGAEIMSRTIKALQNGELKSEKQDNNKTCYSPMLSKELCPIDFNRSAKEIHNQVRGLSPWPVATAQLNGKKVKIHKTKLSDISGGDSGEVVAGNGSIVVSCGDKKCIEILELQLEGKKRMCAKDFLLGHTINCGEYFK